MIKSKIIHRLKIAKGHLEKVILMAQADAYCIDIVHQSMAVQAALKQVDEVVLRNHMENCVADSIKQGKTKEVVDEVIRVLEKK